MYEFIFILITALTNSEDMPEEHQFLFKKSNLSEINNIKTGNLELGGQINSTLKMVKYGNETILERDELGYKALHNTQNERKFNEGLLAVEGSKEKLAIEDDSKKIKKGIFNKKKTFSQKI